MFFNPEIQLKAEKAIRSIIAEGGDDSEIILDRLIIFKIGSQAMARKPKDIAYISDFEVSGEKYEIYAR